MRFRSRVAKKAADRKRKADEQKELAWELFRKGLKPDATEALLLDGQARAVALGKLVKRFESDSFQKTFAGHGIQSSDFGRSSKIQFGAYCGCLEKPQSFAYGRAGRAHFAQVAIL